jgi:peptide/nickel transport system ATP-binding protein
MNATPLLRLHRISARPGGPGGRAVLHDCSLTVLPHEAVGLLGESGAGKTTLLRTVAGLIPLVAGTRHGPGRIGWLPQHPLACFDPRWRLIDSVAEGAYLAGSTRRQARTLAERMLTDVELPPRLWDRRPAALSGGQLRRGAVARALVADPPLLLADEPTAGLDPVAAQSLIALVRDRITARGTAVLWATHDLGTIAGLATRVVVLERGGIVEDAPMNRLMITPGSEAARRLLGAWLPLDPVAARRQLARPGSVPAPGKA